MDFHSGTLGHYNMLTLRYTPIKDLELKRTYILHMSTGDHIICVISALDGYKINVTGQKLIMSDGAFVDYPMHISKGTEYTINSHHVVGYATPDEDVESIYKQFVENS